MPFDLLQLFGKQVSATLDLDHLSGPMRLYVETCARFTDAKPGFLLTAWLPFVAVNAGNRVFMYNNSTRIFPNIWSCIIGPSSVSRKTTALNYAAYTIDPYMQDLIDGALKDYEQNTLVLSGTTLSKLMSYLAANPCRLFVHHEIAAWLNEMGKAYNAGYRQIITELFDGVNRTVSNQDRTEKIVMPALSIAAATTEGWLFKNLADTADQMSGFMQRMIFYVVKNVAFDDLDLRYKDGQELPELLGQYDSAYFQYWRDIPEQYCIRLSDAAMHWKSTLYLEEYLKYYKLGNDNVMSYFTRIYDNYFYKFCMLIWLLDIRESDWLFCKDKSAYADLFEGSPVSLEQAQQAWYLCRFYMLNTLPLITMLDEKDKLAGEKKVMDILVRKFGGKSSHSILMNTSRMRKREFHDVMESLIDRGAVTCSAGPVQANHVYPKTYIAHPDIVDSWSEIEKEVVFPDLPAAATTPVIPGLTTPVIPGTRSVTRDPVFEMSDQTQTVNGQGYEIGHDSKRLDPGSATPLRGDPGVRDDIEAYPGVRDDSAPERTIYDPEPKEIDDDHYEQMEAV